MTTFTLPSSNPPCRVRLPPGTVPRDELLAFPAFKTWTSTLIRSLDLQTTNRGHAFHALPYSLKSIDVQSVDRFGGGRLGFVKLKAEIVNEQGESLPGSVFLRGGSVAMMILLQPDDVAADCETDKHVLLTVQPRIPAGSLSFVELPAGMIDDAGTFAGAAAKEIREETGLDLPSERLIDMTSLAAAFSHDKSPGSSDESLQKATYSSPGGTDEFIPIFLHQCRVPRQQLSEWTGRLTGLRDSGEKITIKCVPLEDLWWQGLRDAKALGALALYHGLSRHGRI